MADFRQFLTIFLLEFINIGPVYIRGWAAGARGWGGWWQKLNLVSRGQTSFLAQGAKKEVWPRETKLNQRRNKTQRVEFRVAMTCTCTHKGPIFHYKA